MQQALPPQHEARSDHEIFVGLAERLGFAEAFTDNKDEQQWLRDMWQRSQQAAEQQGFQLPSFDVFQTQGIYRLPDEPRVQDWLANFRSNPEKFPLGTPSGKLELFSHTIAAFDYEDCPGHATWLEPLEWRSSKRELYSLHLLSPQPRRRLHSQYDQSSFSQAGKVKGCEVLTMHPEAAAQRSLLAGDLVRVFNERGACLAGLVLDDKQRMDTVILPTGAWFKPCPETGLELNGNPNVLTRDKGTSSLAQGPTAHTCLVQVELYQQKR